MSQFDKVAKIEIIALTMLDLQLKWHGVWLHGPGQLIGTNPCSKLLCGSVPVFTSCNGVYYNGEIICKAQYRFRCTEQITKEDALALQSYTWITGV